MNLIDFLISLDDEACRACLKMKNLVVLLLVLVAAAISRTYAQVRYPAMMIPVANGVCPLHADREAVIDQIKADVRNILRNYSTDICDGTSGWNRIAFLDMSDPTMQCPGIWREILNSTVVNSTVPGLRACGGVRLGDRVCDSNVFPNIAGIAYRQVCGRMVGYQLSAPDAFRPYHEGSVRNIEGAYLDGVSVTHGSVGSRQHIWSFAVGESETSSSTASCPCNAGTSVTIPPFVGNDYFCESGVSVVNCAEVYYGDDPLWDGMNCDPSSTCCEFNSPPYFTKTLSSPTTDGLEVRLCSYDSGCISDIAVSFIELYVK